jgi:hypothetical protein
MAALLPGLLQATTHCQLEDDGYNQVPDRVAVPEDPNPVGRSPAHGYRR